MGNKVLRLLWMALGFLSVGVGVIGIVVPGLPTTVFFVIAAACFSRSSPRFEQWVLSLPTIGPMVSDYRSGLGMPKRAKIAAVTSIVVVCSASAIFALERIWLRLAVLALGGIGVAWILLRIPTKVEAPDTTPVAARPLGFAGRLFRIVAFAEAVTWLGLLVGMLQKYVIDAGEGGVQVFGRVHGIVVLVYFGVAVWVGRRQRWSSRSAIYALLASVPPLATVVFERWAYRTGRLDRR